MKIPLDLQQDHLSEEFSRRVKQWACDDVQSKIAYFCTWNTPLCLMFYWRFYDIADLKSYKKAITNL